MCKYTFSKRGFINLGVAIRSNNHINHNECINNIKENIGITVHESIDTLSDSMTVPLIKDTETKISK